MTPTPLTRFRGALLAATCMAAAAASSIRTDPSPAAVGLPKRFQSLWGEPYAVAVNPVDLPDGTYRTVPVRAWAPKAYAVQVLPGHTLLANLKTLPLLRVRSGPYQDLSMPYVGFLPADHKAFPAESNAGRYNAYTREAIHNPGTAPMWVMVEVELPRRLQELRVGSMDLMLLQLPTEQVRAEMARLGVTSMQFPRATQP